LRMSLLCDNDDNGMWTSPIQIKGDDLSSTDEDEEQHSPSVRWGPSEVFVIEPCTKEQVIGTGWLETRDLVAREFIRPQSMGGCGGDWQVLYRRVEQIEEPDFSAMGLLWRQLFHKRQRLEEEQLEQLEQLAEPARQKMDCVINLHGDKRQKRTPTPRLSSKDVSNSKISNSFLQHYNDHTALLSESYLEDKSPRFDPTVDDAEMTIFEFDEDEDDFDDDGPFIFERESPITHKQHTCDRKQNSKVATKQWKPYPPKQAHFHLEEMEYQQHAELKKQQHHALKLQKRQKLKQMLKLVEARQRRFHLPQSRQHR